MGALVGWYVKDGSRVVGENVGYGVGLGDIVGFIEGNSWMSQSFTSIQQYMSYGHSSLEFSISSQIGNSLMNN